MVEYPVKRVAVILLTAMMLFSTIVVVMPQSTVSAASETNDISLKVKDYSDSHLITDAVVKFTEVHTGKVITATYSDSCYHSGWATPPGYYRIDISRSRYFSVKDITGVEFDGTAPITLDTVYLHKFGNDQYSYTVTVKDKNNAPIQGASVKLYNETYDQYVNSSTTDTNGQATQKVFDGWFTLVVSADNYETNVTNIDQHISASGSKIVNLNNSVIVDWDVKKKSGTGEVFASNVVSYLYNVNTSLHVAKRILKSTNGATFYAYPGNWVIIIDGSDVNCLVENITLVSSTDRQTKVLENQTQSFENRTISWTDWNSLWIQNDAAWNADKTYRGFDYSDIGCLRAQIDLALGNANGMVDDAEKILFENYVCGDHSPDWVTTSEWLHVKEIGDKNRTQYLSTSINIHQYATDLTGYVGKKGNITYQSKVTYTTQTALNTAVEFFWVSFNATFDSSAMNRSFVLDLPSNSEMISNSSDATAYAKIKGYQIVTVKPLLSATAGVAHTTLGIDKSAPPVAKGEIVEAPNTYKKMNGVNVSYYVVKVNTNVSFSSTLSSDPNGNPLTYNWSFGDGQYNVTKSKTAYHNYTTVQNVTVTLTVTDVVGFSNSTTFNVSVDGRTPRPAIKITNMTGSALTLPITIDQGDSLKFFPDGSVDDLLALNDGDGIIESYVWKFGNDTPISTNNYTYPFDTAGTIKVVLNVTDVVGNWKNTTVSITVRDKEGPTVSSLTTLNATWGVTLLERSIIYFDATKTTDNIDNVSLLEFNWTFGDGSAQISGVGLSFANVTHNYSSYGQYNLILNVTDQSGNNASITRTLYIGMSKRPDVYPDQVTFSPTTFEEYVSGRITVNITNKGSAVAKGITIELWWYSGTTAQKRIGNITTLYNPNGTAITSLGVGESGYGYLDWTPDAKGNYTVRAVVNSTDQPSSNWGQGTMDVKEASWKGVVVPVGLLILVIAIPLILLARRRIGSMGAMMRRPKSEREGKERKEEK